MTKPPTSQHDWKYGWAAFAVTLLPYLGLAAGLSKNCLSQFDLGAAIGYISLATILGGFAVPVFSLPALLIPAPVLSYRAAVYNCTL